MELILGIIRVREKCCPESKAGVRYCQLCSLTQFGGYLWRGFPIYLIDTFGFNVKDLALYAWVPYVGAMFGAWFGGLLAQNLLSAGWSVDKTRKICYCPREQLSCFPP